MKDLEEFEQLRNTLTHEIDVINKRITYRKNLKKIKKATKNMIEYSTTPSMIIPKQSNEPALGYIILDKDEED